MRNCFVPGCDAACKKSGKISRKMFLAPAAKIAEWTAKLPKKRTFKPHDRVCELHFKPEDIIEFWETNINGEVHRTQRNKPKLRESAIPCLNLPSTKEISHHTVEDLNTKSEKIEILSHKTLVTAKRKLPAPIGKKLVTPKKVKIIHPAIPKPVQKQVPAALKVPEAEISACSEVPDERLAMFETLYDEAFDVTLPSLLWGIHRDPERKFIAFSEFDSKNMKISKLLHISNKFECTTHINSVPTLSKSLIREQLAVEHVSMILDELDKEKTT